MFGAIRSEDDIIGPSPTATLVQPVPNRSKIHNPAMIASRQPPTSRPNRKKKLHMPIFFGKSFFTGSLFSLLSHQGKTHTHTQSETWREREREFLFYPICHSRPCGRIGNHNPFFDLSIIKSLSATGRQLLAVAISVRIVSGFLSYRVSSTNKHKKHKLLHFRTI